MRKWVADCICGVSEFLSRIAAYQDKNIELLLQVYQELLSLLLVFNGQHYSRYLTYNHFELQVLITKILQHMNK